MKHAKLWTVILLAYSLNTLCAQTRAPDERSRMSALLSQTLSQDWRTREKALYGLIDLGWQGATRPPDSIPAGGIKRLIERNPSLRDQLIRSLIKQLEAANSLAKSPFEEEFSEYYASLLEVASSLRDERMIPVLLDAAGTGGMVSDALASFGERILPIAIARLGSSTDKVTRASWLQVISKMTSPTLAPGLRTAVSRNQIAKVLLEAAGDDDRLIRLMAVNGLQGLSDRDDVRKALEHMAQADPYASEDGRFLVREAATNALQNAPSRPLK